MCKALFTALTTWKVYSNYSSNSVLSGNKISVKLICSSMSKTASAHTQYCAWFW